MNTNIIEKIEVSNSQIQKSFLDIITEYTVTNKKLCVKNLNIVNANLRFPYNVVEFFVNNTNVELEHLIYIYNKNVSFNVNQDIISMLTLIKCKRFSITNLKCIPSNNERKLYVNLETNTSLQYLKLTYIRHSSTIILKPSSLQTIVVRCNDDWYIANSNNIFYTREDTMNVNFVNHIKHHYSLLDKQKLNGFIRRFDKTKDEEYNNVEHLIVNIKQDDNLRLKNLNNVNYMYFIFDEESYTHFKYDLKSLPRHVNTIYLFTKNRLQAEAIIKECEQFRQNIEFIY